MGKNHLSANAMQGGKAEPKKEKDEIVDEFVVQLITDLGKKKKNKGVLQSYAGSAFGVCNKSEFVFCCSQEKSFKCGTKGTQFQVFCCFLARFPTGGIESKVYKFTW